MHYRLPVFRELASRPGVDLLVKYAEYPGSPNVDADGFAAKFTPLRRLSIAGQVLVWHGSQWQNASRRNADVLILSWSLRYVSLLPSLIRARISGVPVVLWGHGVSKSFSRWKFSSRAYLARLSTCVLVYNHTVARRLIEWGLDPTRVFVALNCLDQRPIQAARARWLADPKGLQQFRRVNQLEGNPTVLFVSRLYPENRVDMLLHAARSLSKDVPNLRVVIIGAGESADGLARQVRDLGLQNNVLMPGPIYEEEKLAPYFLSADVFCYPQSIGLSLLHAFGYGLPVVTSDDPRHQNPEIEALRPGENGLVYREGDTRSLTEALRTLITDRELAARLSREAHRTAVEQFTLKNMVDGFEAAINYCRLHHPSQVEAPHTPQRAY
jgi:glycosyltransferase involved in cell wall biosynthesis